jgi:hypothetical protein
VDTTSADTESAKVGGSTRKFPVFYAILAAFILLAAAAVAVANTYINERLREFESAQPYHIAESMLRTRFAGQDFASLISESGYILSDGETLEDAVGYFTGLSSNGDLSYFMATSAFEERADAVVYIVRAGSVNIAKLTLFPSGETTKHGHTLYAPGGIMLIRKDRPAPPDPGNDISPDIDASPDTDIDAIPDIDHDLDQTPSPEPHAPITYSEELQAKHSKFVIEALRRFTMLSRSIEEYPRANVLTYYEPGSAIYKKISVIEPWLVPPSRYSFEDIVADEFVELEDGAFSCRVRFTFKYRVTGKNGEDFVDYTLFLRPNAAGKYLVYDQHLTGMVSEP